MCKGLKGLAALGVVGCVSYGVFKAVGNLKLLKETHNNVIMFYGEKLIYDEAFEGDSVAVIGASVELDLREADFVDDVTSIDLYGMGAGFKVLVPANIKVVAVGINKASGVEVNVDETIEGPVLNIYYDLTGSGLLVTTKNL